MLFVYVGFVFCVRLDLRESYVDRVIVLLVVGLVDDVEVLGGDDDDIEGDVILGEGCEVVMVDEV